MCLNRTSLQCMIQEQSKEKRSGHAGSGGGSRRPPPGYHLPRLLIDFLPPFVSSKQQHHHTGPSRASPAFFTIMGMFETSLRFLPTIILMILPIMCSMINQESMMSIALRLSITAAFGLLLKLGFWLIFGRDRSYELPPDFLLLGLDDEDYAERDCQRG